MPRLTKRAVDGAPLRKDRYLIWDTEERGLGVLVYPTGIKSLVFQYDTLLGRSRRLVIGRYGDLTLDEARLRAKRLRVVVRDGGDPAGERAADRRAPTMNDLFDRYLRDHVEVHNAPTTVADTRRLIDARLRPQFGSMPIKSLTGADVARMHAAMRSTPRRANLTLAVLSKAMNLAELWGLRAKQSNPVRGIKRYPETNRTRFLAPDEITRLGATLREAENPGLPWEIDATAPGAKHVPKENRRTPIPWQAIAAIRLLLHSGARRSEILALEWSHVDRDRGTVALQGVKGRERVPHPVGAVVLDILSALPRPGSKWVLPRSDDPARHYAAEALNAAWERIRRHAAIDDVHLHDLRHTVGTLAAQNGVNAFIIRDLLRHKDIKTIAQYANFDEHPVRAISNAVGDKISDLLGPPTTSPQSQRKKRRDV